MVFDLITRTVGRQDEVSVEKRKKLMKEVFTKRDNRQPVVSNKSNEVNGQNLFIGQLEQSICMYIIYFAKWLWPHT